MSSYSFSSTNGKSIINGAKLLKHKPSTLTVGNNFLLPEQQFSLNKGVTNPIHVRKARKCLLKRILALDAAMPFDFEAIERQNLEARKRLKVGIVGFGNFGQFIAKRIVKHNHTVIAFSRADYESVAKEIGVKFFRDLDDFCEDHPDVVIMATSILSTDKVLKAIPLQRLKRSTLFVDVLSVKEFPRALFLNKLPPEFDILCTHPMFGPESGRGSWSGLPFVFEKRHYNGPFLRVLGKLQLESTPINTKGYETLLQLVENTMGDSFDLYYGLFMYNVNATEQLNNLERAFDDVKKQLFGQLHDVLRAQLFEVDQVQPPSAQIQSPGEVQREGPRSPLALPPPPSPTLSPPTQSENGVL